SLISKRVQPALVIQSRVRMISPLRAAAIVHRFSQGRGCDPRQLAESKRPRAESFTTQRYVESERTRHLHEPGARRVARTLLSDSSDLVSRAQEATESTHCQTFIGGNPSGQRQALVVRPPVHAARPNHAENMAGSAQGAPDIAVSADIESGTSA